MLTILSRGIHGFEQKNTAARDGARRGVSDPGDQVGGIAAMGAGQALFLLPAGDGPGKGFAGIGLQSPMAGHAKGKGTSRLPPGRRPDGLWNRRNFPQCGIPGGWGRRKRSFAGGRGGRRIAIQKTGDAIRQNGFTARGGQFFLQIRIGAEGFAIRQLVQGRSFVQGRGLLRKISPSFSR